MGQPEVGRRRAAAHRVPQVGLQVKGAVALMRLNRPQRLNAITEACREQILDHLERLRDRTSVRALIVTGAGRGFSAGGDLERLLELREAGDERGFARILDGQLALSAALRSLPQIVIAAVNGPCAGAGLDLALACDIRIASRSATFGAPFLKLGILPDATAASLLPALVGRSRALELFLRADFICAAEAERVGLVSRVVGDSRLLPSARSLAGEVAARPRHLVERLKASLRDDAPSLDPTRAAQLAAFRAPESRTAIRAACRKK